MKQSYFTIFLILFSAICSAQKLTDKFEYKATYSLTWQPDSTDSELLKKERMLLFMGSDGSKFSSFGKHVKDSLFNLYKKDKDKIGFQEYRAKVPEMHFKYVLYQNLITNTVTHAKRIGNDKVLYTESVPMDWEMSKERDEILGYKVQKAHTRFRGRNYTAWFSEDIPFSSGPYKFNGLPGLILKIKDEDEDYIFLLKGFQKLEEPISPSTQLEEFLNTTRENFIDIQDGYNNDPFGALERSGMRFPSMSAKEKAQRTREYRRNRENENNPIELE